MNKPTVAEAQEVRDLAFQDLRNAQEKRRIKVVALRLAELVLRNAIDRERYPANQYTAEENES